jgi:hypothetical protein
VLFLEETTSSGDLSAPHPLGSFLASRQSVLGWHREAKPGNGPGRPSS